MRSDDEEGVSRWDVMNQTSSSWEDGFDDEENEGSTTSGGWEFVIEKRHRRTATNSLEELTGMEFGDINSGIDDSELG